MSEEKNDQLLPEEEKHEQAENQQVPQEEISAQSTEEPEEDVSDEHLTEKSADAIVNEIHAEIAGQSEQHSEWHRQADVDTSGYAGFSPAQLADELRDLLDKYEVMQIRKTVSRIQQLFEKKYREAKEKARQQYLEANDGDDSGFYFHLKEKDVFDNLLREYRRRLKDARRQYEQKLLENKAKREALIEELKNLVQGKTPVETSDVFKKFKEIQQNWRKAGNVPQKDYENLWKSFKYWEEQFFDLIEWDREYRKKVYEENLQAKQKIIERARQLLDEENMSKAFRELQHLHKIWKEETGPVAPELREEIWQEFKSLTKQIHDKRREYLARVREERKKEWERKEGLVQQLAEIAQKEADTHDGWQKLAKQVEEIHASFFSGYRAPKSIVDAFFEQLHTFNRKKNSFYKAYKAVLKENLNKKKALLEEARTLKDSEDLKAAKERCIELQKQWREIGPAPRKVSKHIWEDFQNTCREFFDVYHSKVKEEITQEYQNYLNKKEFLQQLKERFQNEEEPLDVDIIQGLREQWKALGHVPEKVRFINHKFHRFLISLYRRLNIDKTEIELMEYRQHLEAISAGKPGRLEREARFVREKIETLKRDLSNTENNLNFFKVEDENNPVLKEAKRKIEQLRASLELWQKKQKLLNEIRRA